MKESKTKEKGPRRTDPPAHTPELREKQLISLAVNLAEKKLMDGSASSQLITHYLRLGSTMAQLEREKLRSENKLLEAKTEALQSSKRAEELYAEAMEAFKRYNGDRSDV